MKVLHIHDQEYRLERLSTWDTRIPAGIPIYLAHLMNAFEARGVKVAMVRFVDAPGDGARETGFYELPAASLRLSLSAFRGLREVIRCEQPDVVHLHSVYYAMHPLMIRDLSGLCPVVHTLHDVTPLCFRHTKLYEDGSLCEAPVGFNCVRRGCYQIGTNGSRTKDLLRVLMNPLHLSSYRQLPLMLVPSCYLAKQLALNGFDSSRIRVLPQFSRFGVTREGEVADEKPLILFVGRLVKEKGILEFIRALGMLSLKDWRAVVVGDGDLRSAVVTMIADLKLTDQVELVGTASASELAGHYRRANVVVFPSTMPESFGMVGVEAMSFGKPVVGFGCGGVLEWLRHMETGLVAEHGNVGQLASHLDMLLADAALREHLGMGAAAAVECRFTVKRHVDLLFELYEESIEAFQRR